MVDPPPLLRPVEGPVVSRFSYDRAAPFQPGRRRIVRFRAAPGSAVRSPCRGRVSHAGRLPVGDGVTVRCGRWSVTLTGVAPRVARGRRAGKGATVARVATSTPSRGPSAGSVGLGVRRTADRFGYVDPLPLLRAPQPAQPFAPVGPAPRARPVAPVASPVARPVPALLPTGPVVGVRPVGDRVPWPAWGGLALLALAVPAGAFRLRVRRRAAPARSAGLRPSRG